MSSLNKKSTAEVLTPGWRLVEPYKQHGLSNRIIEEEDEDPEPTDEETYIRRHKKIELRERYRFLLHEMRYQNHQWRYGGGRKAAAAQPLNESQLDAKRLELDAIDDVLVLDEAVTRLEAEWKIVSGVGSSSGDGRSSRKSVAPQPQPQQSRASSSSFKGNSRASSSRSASRSESMWSSRSRRASSSASSSSTASSFASSSASHRRTRGRPRKLAAAETTATATSDELFSSTSDESTLLSSSSSTSSTSRLVHKRKQPQPTMITRSQSRQIEYLNSISKLAECSLTRENIISIAEETEESNSISRRKRKRAAEPLPTTNKSTKFQLKQIENIEKSAIEHSLSQGRMLRKTTKHGLMSKSPSPRPIDLSSYNTFFRQIN